MTSRPNSDGSGRTGFRVWPVSHCPDIDASLDVFAYAFDVLRLDGVVLLTNANGVYLGDAVLEPVF